MSPTNTFSDDDPLAIAMRPPSDESAEARSARLAQEAAAKKVSDEIDAMIAADNKKRKARAKKEVRVLLLGQSESGKSTCLKQFRILYAPQSFVAERDSWRTVIYLNLVKSIRRVLDAVSAEEESFSDDSGDIDAAVSANNRRRRAEESAAARAKAATPISFDAPGGDDAGRGSTDDTYAQYAAIKLRLSPLAVAEELLIRRLAGPDGEDEATNLGAWAPTSTTAPTASRIKEVFVRSSSNWKKGIFSSNKKNGSVKSDSSSGHSGSKHADDPIALVQACREDMIMLWKDQSVQATLRRKGIRLEEMPGFYLNDIARITSRSYSPSNQDVLNARLKTLGVVEHLFTLESVGGEKGYDWRIYDVGGHREQRHTWVPFFDDVHAIIFLAPISAFDQVLTEDKRVNRLEDSLLLFRQICANKLLGKVNMVLFLNKIDILEKKLQSGVKLNRYIRSYGERPNTVESVSQYLLAKFVSVHKDSSPYPGRELYTHMTTVTDTNATAAIIADVREMILRRHLQQSSLM